MLLKDYIDHLLAIYNKYPEATAVKATYPYYGDKVKTEYLSLKDLPPVISKESYVEVPVCCTGNLPKAKAELEITRPELNREYITQLKAEVDSLLETKSIDEWFATLKLLTRSDNLRELLDRESQPKLLSTSLFGLPNFFEYKTLLYEKRWDLEFHGRFNEADTYKECYLVFSEFLNTLINDFDQIPQTLDTLINTNNHDRSN